MLRIQLKFLRKLPSKNLVGQRVQLKIEELGLQPWLYQLAMESQMFDVVEMTCPRTGAVQAVRIERFASLV